MKTGSNTRVAAWPKRPPVLSAEQERAREAFVTAWHQVLPRGYAGIERFNHGSVARLPFKEGSVTLEVGAGLGAHSKFEDLTQQDYYCLEYRQEFCKELEKLFPPSRVTWGDIEQRQQWPDGFFDRIVAIHVLEHLRNLPAALLEIRRLLKPDGHFDVVLPCEGGLAYALARKISAERLFRRRFAMDYSPIIANEHVSQLEEILHELGLLFDVETRSFYPLGIPISTLNLVVALRLTPRPPR